MSTRVAELGNVVSIKLLRGAKRVAPNQKQCWTITVRARSSEAVTVSLAATTDCTGAAATCIPDGRPLSNSVSAMVEGPSLEPLTAAFEGAPSKHDGSTFTFPVEFSEDAEVTPRVLRETAFGVTGGTGRRASPGATTCARSTSGRRAAGRSRLRCRLPPTAARPGRSALRRPAAVEREPGDGERTDGHLGCRCAGRGERRAVLAFAGTLSRAMSPALTVDYATADGSGRAGEHYTAASGTLSFQAGESSGRIEARVLDDAHDEGEETLFERLGWPGDRRRGDRDDRERGPDAGGAAGTDRAGDGRAGHPPHRGADGGAAAAGSYAALRGPGVTPGQRAELRARLPAVIRADGHRITGRGPDGRRCDGRRCDGDGSAPGRRRRLWRGHGWRDGHARGCGHDRHWAARRARWASRASMRR